MERLVDKRFFVGHFRNKTFSGKALESFIPEMTSKKTFTYTKPLINETLINEGHAYVYEGGTKKVFKG